ncbi:MAG: MBL fold metallo-hydrolase [Beijerinckiaceae bacterium]|nr:MBL fold metallo-hydrolase [Beijerinckiaceae bacterium]
MNEQIPFDRSFAGAPGEFLRLSGLVRRMVAPNPGPMTFMGTCTYVVGQDEVAVIDPGPDMAQHIKTLLASLRGESIAAILVTHTHKDHAGAARALKSATGARIIGCAPAGMSGNPLDAAHDFAYAPDEVMREGDAITGQNFSLSCVETQGHTKNHLAFALPQEGALFTGDHVMAWSTSVVAPPDGAMRPYMVSLEKLLGRNDKVYWPGHGGPVKAPRNFVSSLIRHRRKREEAILARIKAGDRTIAAIAAKVYASLDPALANAAAYSVLAHIEDLAERGLVQPEGAMGIGGIFRPA